MVDLKQDNGIENSISFVSNTQLKHNFHYPLKIFVSFKWKNTE